MPLRLSRRSKYGAKRTLVRGTWFASKREAAVFQDLLYRQAAKEIETIVLQPRFDLTVNGVKVCSYVGDFLVTKPGGEVEILDAKGFKTPAYRLKAKLFHALYGFAITEVR
jgi:hypothetical protein